MEIDQVPQDESSTYKHFSRVMYATDAKGKYASVVSNGWDTEEFITRQALSVEEEQLQAAIEMVTNGEKSPIYFYMHYFKYDIRELAQSTGLFQWRIKRHMKPSVFAQLSDEILTRYATAFHLSIEQIKQIPHIK